MKEKIRLKLKIFSSLLMCLLSLFSIVSLTLAWFAVNDKASGDGMNVAVSQSEILDGYQIYRVNGTSNGAYELTELPNNQTPSLNVYDDLAGNYQLVVKLKFKSDAKNVKITGLTSTNYFLGDGNHPLLSAKSESELNVPKTGSYNGSDYTNALSSIVGMTLLTDDEVSAFENKTLTQLPQESRLSVFISGSVVSSEIEIATTSDLNAYVFITYDALLVNTVFSVNIGNDDMYLTDSNGSILTGENGLPYPIPFVWDFSIAAEAV